MEKPPKTDRVLGADRIPADIRNTQPQIELKLLTPRVGLHTSSPPLEAFGVTTNGLAYRESAKVRGSNFAQRFVVTP